MNIAPAQTDPLPTFETTPYQTGRAEMLISLLPRHSVGAELGVFKGEFSATIIKAIEPRELYLVDPWDLAYGANYPDWGDYTLRGALTTERAVAETLSRTTSNRKTKVKLVKDYSLTWLPSMPDEYFDWIYLDSTHAYDDTVEELNLCKRKVKKNGVICGHDFAIGRNDMHHAVFRAVTEFTRKGEFELIWAGPWIQWAIRRSEIPVVAEAPASSAIAGLMNYDGLTNAYLDESHHLGGNIRGGDPYTWCPKVWNYVVERFGIRSVVDFGSGNGNAALYFHRRGLYVCAVEGLEENVTKAVFPTIKHDVTTAPFLADFDLIHCQEVVEHIGEEFLPNLLATFSRAKFVLMTHAVPGQRGFHHVNCQPAEYWIKQMEGISFSLFAEDTRRIRELAKSEGATYMSESGLLFANNQQI